MGSVFVCATDTVCVQLLAVGGVYVGEAAREVHKYETDMDLFVMRYAKRHAQNRRRLFTTCSGITNMAETHV